MPVVTRPVELVAGARKGALLLCLSLLVGCAHSEVVAPLNCAEYLRADALAYRSLIPEDPSAELSQRLCADIGILEKGPKKLSAQDAKIARRVGQSEVLRPARLNWLDDRQQLSITPKPYGFYENLGSDFHYWYATTADGASLLVDTGAISTTLPGAPGDESFDTVSSGAVSTVLNRSGLIDLLMAGGEARISDALVSTRSTSVLGLDALLSKERVCIDLRSKRISERCPDEYGAVGVEVPYFLGLVGHLFVMTKVPVWPTPLPALFDTGQLLTTLEGSLCTEADEVGYIVDSSRHTRQVLTASYRSDVVIDRRLKHQEVWLLCLNDNHPVPRLSLGATLLNRHDAIAIDTQSKTITFYPRREHVLRPDN